MKIRDGMIKQLVREKINLDEMLFRFLLGQCITDIVFQQKQLLEKSLAVSNLLYLAFIALKRFDKVLCFVVSLL